MLMLQLLAHSTIIHLSSADQDYYKHVAEADTYM